MGGAASPGAHVAKAGVLQCAVWRNIERIGLAIQTSEPQNLAVVQSGQADEPRAQASRPALGVDDVQVHVGLDTKLDLVCGAEADERVVELPPHAVLGALLERKREAGREPSWPLSVIGQEGAFDSESSQMFVSGLVEARHAYGKIGRLHRSDAEGPLRHGRAA